MGTCPPQGGLLQPSLGPRPAWGCSPETVSRIPGLVWAEPTVGGQSRDPTWCLTLKPLVLCCSAFAAQDSAVMHLPATIGTLGPVLGRLRGQDTGWWGGGACYRVGLGAGRLSGLYPRPSWTQASLKAGALPGWLLAAGICGWPSAPFPANGSVREAGGSAPSSSVSPSQGFEERGPRRAPV